LPLVLDTLGHFPKDKDPVMDMLIGQNKKNIAAANQLLWQNHLYTDRNHKMYPMTFGAFGGVADHGSYWNADLPAIFF
jgi:hypothetical protein